MTNRPHDYDPAKVQEIYQDALEAWRKNPIAWRAIAITTDFIVGDAIFISSTNRALNKFIQAFWNHPKNNLSMRLQGMSDERGRAGDLFILLFRMVYVPSDFGTHERGYTFGFHRLSNEQEWKNFPAKYKDSTYCNECHDDKVKPWADSAHGTIPCENCHGAAFGHPEKPAKLTIDRSRGQCLRCHTNLYMLQ